MFPNSSCNQFEYFGLTKKFYHDKYPKNKAGWIILFLSKHIIVEKEYLIYDFIGIVGSVGGTLGLFIGFSFYDLFIYPIERFMKKETSNMITSPIL